MGGEICFVGYFFCLVLFIIGAYYLYFYDKNKKEEMQSAVWADYENALEKLKLDPGNSDLKQRALKLGRKYSSTTQPTRGCIPSTMSRLEYKGVTIYDEVAIMNDINAATASISSLSTSSAGYDRSASIESRLDRLTYFRSKGYITEEEYEERRQRILDEI